MEITAVLGKANVEKTFVKRKRVSSDINKYIFDWFGRHLWMTAESER